MACENLSNSYPIAMKFSGYLTLCGDVSTIDFGPDRSIRRVGYALKVGQNELDCSGERERYKHFWRCYRYVLFNNLVLAVSKIIC